MSLYEKFTFRGKTMDRLTIASFHAAEKRLNYANTLVQGSYNRGVGASAGTHDGGGAADLVWFDTPRKVRAFRRYGCMAYWPRPAIPGVWGAHHHGIVLGNNEASPSAKQQMVAYRNGRNGLANNGKDPYWRPRKIRDFSYSRANVISYRRLNLIAKMPGGRPLLPEGAKQVKVVERALQGFNMDMPGHKPGRMDEPLLDAIKRFRRIRKVGETDVKGPLSPKVCYELCIPTREN